MLYNEVGDSMKIENKITVNNLIYALLFLVFGVILLTSTEDLISIASKVIGIGLIVVGIVKAIIYVYMKGKLGNYKLTELLIGLIIICCGSVLLIYSGALSFAIRTIIGLWILFAGVNRIILAISIKLVDNSGFKIYLITSILMLIMGIFLISGLFDKLIGLFIIGYSITEIIDYIYFKSKNKNYGSVKNNSKKNKKEKIKRLKEEKIVEAVIEEETK